MVLEQKGKCFVHVFCIMTLMVCWCREEEDLPFINGSEGAGVATIFSQHGPGIVAEIRLPNE